MHYQLMHYEIFDCIAFAVTRLSRFNSEPTEEHLRYAKYVLRYLKGTKSLRICYNGSSNASLIGYSDSDWGENKDDHHSTSGQVFTLANGAISWASQRQKMVALSVGESEYMELAATGRQCAWLRSFMLRFHSMPTIFGHPPLFLTQTLDVTLTSL